MFEKLCYAAASIGMLCMVETASAAPITSLFNTGVTDLGAIISGGQTDHHYSIFASPDPSYPGPAAIGVNDNAIPFDDMSPFQVGAWFANGPNSRWIGPRADGADNSSGNYTYRTTFGLFGLDPTTAVITGKWATDNSGVSILINGIDTGITRPGENGYSAFSAQFVINHGFVNGLNNLDFVVFNFPSSTLNPTGFRAEVSGTANVPEPAASPILLFVTLITVTMRSRQSPAWA